MSFFMNFVYHYGENYSMKAYIELLHVKIILHLILYFSIIHYPLFQFDETIIKIIYLPFTFH